MARRPTSLNAIDCADVRHVVAMAMQRLTISGNFFAHTSVCMPPSEPPITASSEVMPMISSIFRCTMTMSLTVTTGKLMP